MIAGMPTWVAILIGLGTPTILVTIIGAVIKWFEWRRERRANRERELREQSDSAAERDEARQERREESDAAWNRRARRNIERHIPWDARAAAHIVRLEELMNDLRVDQGKAPIPFEPLGEPPPLFPSDDPQAA